MEKILITSPKEYEAVTGEKLELHFKLISLPMLSSFQRKLIEAKVNQMRNLKVEAIEMQDNVLVLTVIVADNPFPLILLIGGVITILSGFFIWGSLDKVYKIIESPEGKVVGISASIGVIVGLVILSTLLLRRG